MRFVSGCVVVALVLSGCPQETPPPPPPARPRAFLSIPETTVIAPTIKGTVTTSGCSKVFQVQILESNNFLIDARYAGEPTSFELQPSLFNGLYNQRGLAIELNLTAKVVCEELITFADGGTATKDGVSQPIAVTFLPVRSVRSEGNGRMALPDVFVAEGGINNQPTSFIGCTATTTGRALVRVDQNGTLLAINPTLPFDCDFRSRITDRNPTSGLRWLWVEQLGAFAFDGNLNITSIFKTPDSKVARLSVSPADGDAVVAIEDEISAVPNQLTRLRARPAMGQNPVVWTTLMGPMMTIGYPGEFSADPLVEPGMRRIYTSSWQKRQQDTFGIVAVLVFNYDTGQLINDPPPAVVRLDFPNTFNRAIKPVSAFSADGTVLYAPILSVANDGQLSTTVVACPSNAPLCPVGVRRWTSPTFLGELTTVVPFSRGNFLSIIGPFATWFLGANDGRVKNLGEMQPLRPSGSLLTLGVVPGRGNDFYLLNGPPRATENSPLTFPTEVIATDAPAAGELWKVQIQGGTQPADSMYLAVDDNGQPWMRVGLDQIRPLGLMEYRNQRGATTPP